VNLEGQSRVVTAGILLQIMLKFVLPGLALSALCGCDAGSPGAPRQLPPDRPTWSTTTDAGVTRLAYGVPQTDNVALSFDCRLHSGQITVSGPLAPGATRLVLASGPVVDRIAGRSEPDPESGLNFLTGLADARDAALAAFARTGRLVRIDPGGSTALPALGWQRVRVRIFLDACAR
jgi:hypothetical protein